MDDVFEWPIETGATVCIANGALTFGGVVRGEWAVSCIHQEDCEQFSGFGGAGIFTDRVVRARGFTPSLTGVIHTCRFTFELTADRSGDHVGHDERRFRVVVSCALSSRRIAYGHCFHGLARHVGRLIENCADHRDLVRVLWRRLGVGRRREHHRNSQRGEWDF